VPGLIRRECSERIVHLVLRGQWHKRPDSEILGKIVDLAQRWEGDDPMADAPADVISQALGFVAEAKWRFATSMADNPHWYIVRPQITDERVHALVELLKHHSRIKRWHGQIYRAVSLDQWDYWDIWPVINRKPTRFAGWDGEPRPPRNWLPDEAKRDHRGDEPMPEPTQSELPWDDRYQWNADDVERAP
jgi:hypothetical protein